MSKICQPKPLREYFHVVPVFSCESSSSLTPGCLLPAMAFKCRCNEIWAWLWIFLLPTFIIGHWAWYNLCNFQNTEWMTWSEKAFVRIIYYYVNYQTLCMFLVGLSLRTPVNTASKRKTKTFVRGFSNHCQMPVTRIIMSDPGRNLRFIVIMEGTWVHRRTTLIPKSQCVRIKLTKRWIIGTINGLLG